MISCFGQFPAGDRGDDADLRIFGIELRGGLLEFGAHLVHLGGVEGVRDLELFYAQAELGEFFCGFVDLLGVTGQGEAAGSILGGDGDVDALDGLMKLRFVADDGEHCTVALGGGHEAAAKSDEL